MKDARARSNKESAGFYQDQQIAQHTEKGAALTQLILSIFRANGKLLGEGDQLAREFGLTSALWQVLGAISEGPLPVVRIAEAMGLTRQSVQRSVNVLKQKGLVFLEENPHHKRAKLVVLTSAGERAIKGVHEKQVTWVNKLAEGFESQSLERAVRVCEQLIKVI